MQQVFDFSNDLVVLGDVAQDVVNVFKAVDDVDILQHDLQSSSSS